MDDFREQTKKRVMLFMRKQIYDAPPEIGPCTRFILRHLRADGSFTSDIECQTVPRYVDAKDAPSMDGIDRMADEIINRAMNDADGMGRGTQRYVVLSFHDRGHPSEHTSREIIRLAGGKSSFGDPENAGFGVGDVADTETPDARGITAQHMRHTEAMVKQVILAFGQSTRVASEQISFLSTNLNKFMEKHIQMMGLIETLTSHQHTRELETKKQEVWLRGVDEVVDKIKILLPHVINKGFGRKVLPTKSSPAEQELQALVETLSLQQVDAMKGVLTPDQLIVLLNFIERVQSEGHEGDGPKESPAGGEIISLRK